MANAVTVDSVDILTASASLEGRIESLVLDVLTQDDLFLVSVSVRGRKGSRIVEVFIDGDNGVGVKELATLSREVAFLMDAEDLIKGKYHLNVSSPGPDKSLLMERQYSRHKGKRVEVLVRGDETGRWIEGENMGMTEGVLHLATGKDVELLPFASISKAIIKLPW